MTIEPNIDERRNLVSRLFYLITAHCEDAAAQAATGQGRDVSAESIVDLANQLHATGETLTILADAICAVASRGNGKS